MEEAAALADDMRAMPPISNQPQYNMLSRRIEEAVIPVGKMLGMGQVVFSPLAQGILSGKYKPSQTFPADSRGANERINGFMMHMLNRETLDVVDQLSKIAKEMDM